MSEYFAYWHPKTVKDTSPELPIYFTSSKNFRRIKLTVGDVLWAVTSPKKGELRLVGRISVAFSGRGSLIAS